MHKSIQDLLPQVGAWANRDVSNNTGIQRANVWAPDVLRRSSDGRFVTYYSAAAGNTTTNHCIGAAVSTNYSPAGPYRSLPDSIAFPTNVGGAIDPTAFIDSDGAIYVAYNVDGNNHGNGGICGNCVAPIMPSPILLQRMEGDGVTPRGPAVQILDRVSEDGPLVEAPQLVRSAEGVYFLFFSSGCTRAPSYDVKYATAMKITGPSTRAESELLRTGDWDLQAPGSVGVRWDHVAERYVMAFHARVNVTTGGAGMRAMFTTGLHLNGT
ncbi:hypothetical protein B0A49_08028 [Cryomyces minteri]|uniref:Arabinan endo-1,5-alpha-L-arabinosidase A n=2 Tax=Cryomyces minteri TaxID=331657 RepID=A0A4U0WVV4_9PEZI|nr:hypothetical protein B0A49_08028 [Cryomyces minteri]